MADWHLEREKKNTTYITGNNSDFPVMVQKRLARCGVTVWLALRRENENGEEKEMSW